MEGALREVVGSLFGRCKIIITRRGDKVRRRDTDLGEHIDRWMKNSSPLRVLGYCRKELDVQARAFSQQVFLKAALSRQP